jgi:Iron-containing redox enzyme
MTPDLPPHAFHAELARFNASRLAPGRIGPDWQAEVHAELEMRVTEGYFVEIERARVAAEAARAPRDAAAFLRWFETLRERGPGQGDRLFPWLASSATMAQMRWFLTQEAAGEAGFDDLVAMTQVKLAPVRVKLEMARNYWDEMGRGRDSAMHGPLLERLAQYLAIDAAPDRVLPESLALGNAMLAMARSRRYCYQSIGALGAIEMTAPTRAGFVADGLKRLRVPTKKRLYFTLHAVLDVKHSECWNREVLRSLVAQCPDCAVSIGEGALIRLWHGARCFERYRRHFSLEAPQSQAA